MRITACQLADTPPRDFGSATEEVQPKWPLDSSGVPAAKDELQLSIIVLRAAAHGLDSPEAL